MKPLIILFIATSLVGCGHHVNDTDNTAAPATTNSAVFQQPSAPPNSDSSSSSVITNLPATNNPASTNQ